MRRSPANISASQLVNLAGLRMQMVILRNVFLHTVLSFLRDSLLDTFYSLQTFQKIDGNLVKSAYRVEMTITYDLTLREQVSI